MQGRGRNDRHTNLLRHLKHGTKNGTSVGFLLFPNKRRVVKIDGAATEFTAIREGKSNYVRAQENGFW